MHKYKHTDDLSRELSFEYNEHEKHLDLGENLLEKENRVMHTEELPFKDSSSDDCFAQNLGRNEQCNELFSISELLNCFEDYIQE